MALYRKFNGTPTDCLALQLLITKDNCKKSIQTKDNMMIWHSIVNLMALQQTVWHSNY